MRRGKSCLEKTEVLPYVDRILSLYQEMTELSELSPNPEVNALFTELVKMSVQILDESTTQEVSVVQASSVSLLRFNGDYDRPGIDGGSPKSATNLQRGGVSTGGLLGETTPST